MKFRFKTQPYQQEAVSNISKVFKGQSKLDMVRYTRDLGIKKKTEQVTQASLLTRMMKMMMDLKMLKFCLMKLTFCKT